MHETGIMGDDELGLSYQVGRFIQVEFSAGIIDPDGIDGGQLRGDSGNLPGLRAGSGDGGPGADLLFSL